MGEGKGEVTGQQGDLTADSAWSDKLPLAGVVGGYDEIARRFSHHVATGYELALSSEKEAENCTVEGPDRNLITLIPSAV